MAKQREHDPMPNPWELNITELLTLLSRPAYGGWRLRRDVPKERLVELVCNGGIGVLDEEKADTTKSRNRLEEWISRNWDRIESQIPCRGLNRGKCTIFRCSEGRHADCYLAAERYLL